MYPVWCSGKLREEGLHAERNNRCEDFVVGAEEGYGTI